MNRGCEFYEDALVDRTRGALDPERTRRVDDHLDGCADCRATLAAIRAVEAAPAPVPAGLEARIQAAVRRDALGDVRESTPALRLEGRRPRPAWRMWALPAAAAAAVALWLGANELVSPDPATPEADAVAEYDPYGAWPATDGVVAGELVLSQLSVEELEALLEEMER